MRSTFFYNDAYQCISLHLYTSISIPSRDFDFNEYDIQIGSEKYT